MVRVARYFMFSCSNVSSDGDSSPETCAKDDQTDGKTEKHEHMDENYESEPSENEEGKPMDMVCIHNNTI
jgi:hypothetical protein